jgi:DNA-binding beta-propeller fold protein YncE
MPLVRQTRVALFATVATLLSSGAVVGAQPAAQPTNGAPNAYQTVEGWAKMPEGRTWGSTSAVEIDKDGTSIWVAERCGVNNCLGSNLDPVLKFDARGNLVKSFGAGLILSPHGIFVDRDGNVWVTDCTCTLGGGGRGRGGGGGGGGGGRGADTAGGARAAAPPPPPPAADKGHQVYKFSPDGKLLMTLGKAGGGRDPEFFFQPNDVLVAPNGDIYVSEGHGSAPGATARVLKFDRGGKLIGTWGTVVDTSASGRSQPQAFDQPHALAMDSRGRLFVGDRGNNRIKIFDQSGKLLDTWYQFSRPSGIYIDKNDNIYVADSESGSVSRTRPEWLRGIRVGSAKDGSLTAFIPDPNTRVSPEFSGTSAAEGVAVDSKGTVYGAEVGPKALKRYERKP